MDPYRAQLDNSDLAPASRKATGIVARGGQIGQKLGGRIESASQAINKKSQQIARIGRGARAAETLMTKTGVSAEAEKNINKKSLRPLTRDNLGTKPEKTQTVGRRASPKRNLGEHKKIQNALARIRSIFEKHGEKFAAGDEKKLIASKPSKPKFPAFMLALAAIKDILDIPGDLSVVGIILTTLTSFLIAVTLFIWTWNKISGGWWKTRLIRWLWIRYVATILIEFIPGIKLVPTNTIFIFMAYKKEAKIVKLFNRALEELHAAGY